MDGVKRFGVLESINEEVRGDISISIMFDRAFNDKNKVIFYDGGEKSICYKKGMDHFRKGNDLLGFDNNDKERARKEFLKAKNCFIEDDCISNSEETRRASLLMLAEVYFHINEYQSAFEIIKKINKNDFRYWDAMALYYLYEGNINKSLNCLDKSNLIENNKIDYYFRKALVYQEYGLFEEGLKEYCNYAEACIANMDFIMNVKNTRARDADIWDVFIEEFFHKTNIPYEVMPLYNIHKCFKKIEEDVFALVYGSLYRTILKAARDVSKYLKVR